MSRFCVLVCGGRAYRDQAYLNAQLDRLHGRYQFTALVQGGAMGADNLALGWAAKNNIAWATYSARWDLHGKGAGPIRNQMMLDQEKPQLVVAFPGGAGTADMVTKARKAGVRVIEIPPSDAKPKRERLEDDPPLKKKKRERFDDQEPEPMIEKSKPRKGLF